MALKPDLFRVGVVAMLLVVVPGANAVQVTHRAGFDEWVLTDSHRGRTIALALWYPTTTAESMLSYSRAQPGHAARGAPIAPGRWPLVILSHGSGGNRFNQSALGRDEFDALNARLGLSAVTLLPALGTAVLHVDEHGNIGAAIEAYAAMDGVGYAEQDSHLGDGPDIEASKTSRTWHVIVRQAWGDCPAGCLHQQLSFFTVTDTDVERIEPARAMVMVEFATLLDNRGWR